MIEPPSFTFGIEEEYHLVDVQTRDLAAAPVAFMEACQARLGDRVSPEFLRSQIEVGTSVCATIADARRDLTRLRRSIVEVCARHGLAPIAASTGLSGVGACSCSGRSVAVQAAKDCSGTTL